MLLLDKQSTSWTNVVWLPLQLIVCLSHFLRIEACSYDYLRTLPTSIAGRVDRADIVIFGNVRQIYPYPNTNDYTATVIVHCVIKAEPEEMYEHLSRSVMNMVNISHAGQPGGRDMACHLEKNDTRDYMVFLEGNPRYLTLSSPPISSQLHDKSKLLQAATACSYRKPKNHPKSVSICPEPNPGPQCPTTTTDYTTIRKTVEQNKPPATSIAHIQDGRSGDEKQSVQSSSEDNHVTSASCTHSDHLTTLSTCFAIMFYSKLLLAILSST